MAQGWLLQSPLRVAQALLHLLLKVEDCHVDPWHQNNTELFAIGYVITHA
jgi:hypothetical protein